MRLKKVMQFGQGDKTKKLWSQASNSGFNSSSPLKKKNTTYFTVVCNRPAYVYQSWYINLSYTDGLCLLIAFQNFHIYVPEYIGDCCPQQKGWSKLPSLLLLKLDIPRPQPFYKILSLPTYTQVIRADTKQCMGGAGEQSHPVFRL